ncbi:MAG TPA: FliI/YscN family ATPase [Candidatus Angelobacter sp.]|jgi:flagellum-specific ATP synthase|nr:FliI/YscN family ATPase [Candidatus Angelobacter sp.]
MSTGDLGTYFQHLQEFSTWRWEGSVTKVTGQVVESEGPVCSVGEACEIVDKEGNSFPGEIVGFRGPNVLSMPLDKPSGIRYGDKIYTWGSSPTVAVGDELLGRVLNGSLKPIDNLGPCRPVETWHLDNTAPSPMDRVPIRQPIGTGIRAIDGFISCGRGQRLGIFGGSGVGKSTLIGMMTRGTSADLTVLALVGERGREVGEFVEVLGPEGLMRSVVVASTSDQSPLLRIRAAMAATAVAEYFASKGKNVLLVVDSLTRFAMAQREIGLAAGEPPTAKGYTPSCWNMLAQLVERAGQFSTGSITAFYSVLMEGDDQQDPLVDAVRSLLDGHIVLDRRLAAQGHYPPISTLDSLSRLMSQISTPEHNKIATEVRRLLSAYARSEDLIRVGAYQRGADPVLDKALDVLPAINAVLQQKKTDLSTIDQTVTALKALRL